MMGDQSYGVEPSTVDFMAKEIKDAVSMGVQVAIVIGGGNIFRGVEASVKGIERASADYMGMLATVINALALQNYLEKYSIRNPRSVSDRDERTRRTLYTAQGYAAS